MSATGLPPPPTATPLGDDAEPELRRVSVLFADIQGSTALIENLDPEAASLLIDPALRAMIDAAERFDGVVSHRGDGIMAIFGAPSVSEDHGVRACLAALAIRDALAGEAGGVRVRVGIHVGDVVFRPVRVGRSLSQDAVGIAVHIAARLEQSAEPDTICLSDAVWRLARGFVTAEPLDPISVKGVGEPIERFRLLDADRTANRWGVRAANGLASFVDREAERGALGRALDAVAAGQGLRVVQIVGAAGLGKSRLLHEFLATDAARRCHVVSLIGDHHRRSIPFHPVATWLRGWLDVRNTDALAEARRKLTRGISALALLGRIDGDLLERILGLRGPGADIASLGTLARVDFGAAVAALFTIIAGGRRIILVCEDIDTFDTATRELLDSALERLAGHDVLLVTASRQRVRLAGLPANSTRSLTLAPLSDEDASGLLASIDRPLAANAALAASILLKAGGNPLFLEEVAPLVAARGAAAPGLQEAADFDIPDRVEALIADRLARLPRQNRRLVQLCAVIGTDVPLRLIAHLTGIDARELHPRLLKLQSEQLLYESRKYPDPQFSFKHALTRDVAYRTILAARRRTLHARIVEILQGEGEAQQAVNLDDLCFHALQAQLWPEAVHYLQLAARQAVDRAAYQVARAYLARARDIAAGLADDDALAQRRLDILMELQVLVAWNGDYAGLGPYLDEAEQLASRLQDGRRRTRILALRVHVLNILGRLDEAIALGERTRESARAVGDGNLIATAGFFIGQSYFNAGRLREAEQALSENLAAIATMTSPAAPTGGSPMLHHGTTRTITPLTHGTRAMARAFLGAFPAAVEDVGQTSRLAAETGRPYDRVFAFGIEGFVELQRHQGEPAVAALRAALALSEEHDIAQLRPPVLAWLGQSLLLTGDLAGASDRLTMAHRESRAANRPLVQICAATGLALSSLRLGEPDLARRFADEAVEMAGQVGFHAFRVQALRTSGLVLAATEGSEDEGLTVLDAALQLAIELNMPVDVAHSHAALAVSGAAGRNRHLQQAERHYAAAGMSDRLAALRAEIAGGGRPYL